jgi:hypothetical protein
MEARRLTGQWFWMHGDANEAPERLGDLSWQPPKGKWRVDWKKAHAASKFELAGDDDTAVWYEYMEAIAEARGAGDVWRHGRLVPPTDLIKRAAPALAKAFYDQGGVVVGYGHLPSKSGTADIASSEIEALRSGIRGIWGKEPQASAEAVNRNAAGGRA